MSRIPIRARLTGAFALAMLVVLVGAGLFVHVRLKSDLDEAVDAGLQSRASDLAALAVRSPKAIGRPEERNTLVEADESFAQALDETGLLSATGGAKQAVLTREEVRRASHGPILLERRVEGIEGVSRMLARPAGLATGSARLPGDRRLVVVAGATLEERDETLGGVVKSFAFGGPVAVLLASVAGWWLSGLGLAPVEAMRRRAERVSLGPADERLPLPDADDEIRRLGETLNEMLARLRSSFERERRFVADASHELRTPLAVLKTELESALRTGVQEDLREGLTAAVEEVDHLIQLADDLLLLAHAGEGRLRVEPAPVDVHELLERARDRFADRARGHGRAIEVEAPEGLGARLDPLRMRQALGNLVDNALRHGEGTIVLTARPTPSHLVVEVSDQGRGFADGLAEHAFERFARGSTGRAHGSGLGLAIVRAIAEAHGGRAEVVADRAGGVVRLTLPL